MKPTCNPLRRSVLLGLAGLPILAACHATRGNDNAAFVLTLSGQALIAHDLCTQDYDGFDAVRRELQRGDLAMTDLETAILTSESGAATREGVFLHAAGIAELDCLKSMGFGALALANNHAYDFGSAGVLATRKEVLARSVAAAGSGENLDAATRAALIDVRGQRIALVAMATGKIHEGGAATAHRAGINELRLDADGLPMREDVDRISAALGDAAAQADHVVAYLHNHDWGEDMAITRPWTRDFAKHCIHAGANAFFAHGAPLLHGIEMHRGAPLFYGLGSLIFHSRTPINHYRPEVWESAIAHIHFAGSRIHHIELVPIQLNEHGDDPQQHEATRGRPRIAHGTNAQRILRRLQSLSRDLGTSLRIEDDRGYIVYG